MRDQPTTATFELTCLPADAPVEVLGEQRQLVLGGNSFSDAFDGYGVHLYRVAHP